MEQQKANKIHQLKLKLMDLINQEGIDDTEENIKLVEEIRMIKNYLHELEQQQITEPVRKNIYDKPEYTNHFHQ